MVYLATAPLMLVIPSQGTRAIWDSVRRCLKGPFLFIVRRSKLLLFSSNWRIRLSKTSISQTPRLWLPIKSKRGNRSSLTTRKDRRPSSWDRVALLCAFPLQEGRVVNSLVLWQLPQQPLLASRPFPVSQVTSTKGECCDLRTTPMAILSKRLHPSKLDCSARKRVNSQATPTVSSH